MFQGDDAGHVVQGMKLFEYEAATPPQTYQGSHNSSFDLLRVIINIKYKSGTGNNSKPRFYLQRSVPDLSYLPSIGPSVYASVSIAQFPDEGYPYIGVNRDDATKFAVLNWHSITGAKLPIRIRNLEDSNIRIVVPGLMSSLDSINQWSGNYKWIVRHHTCEFGYNEDHGWWNVMAGNNPAIFEEGADSTLWWDSRPSQISELSPYLWYSKVRPSKIVSQLPAFPLIEIFDIYLMSNNDISNDVV